MGPSLGGTRFIHPPVLHALVQRSVWQDAEVRLCVATHASEYTYSKSFCSVLTRVSNGDSTGVQDTSHTLRLPADRRGLLTHDAEELETDDGVATLGNVTDSAH